MNTDTTNITDTLTSDERSLLIAMTKLTSAIERLSERLEKVEADQHRAPCRHVDALDARVTMLEKSSGHFSDAFWKVAAALAAAAAVALWKLNGG